MTTQTNFLNSKTYLLNDSSGVVEYYEDFITTDYYSILQDEISWREESISLFGKTFLQPRLLSFQGDEGIHYSYSNKKYIASKWSQSLLGIKQVLKEKINLSFNCCLLNYYRNGQDSMGWHSDNEKELGPEPTIASLSFGATRVFKYKKDHTCSIKLSGRSLLIMKGRFQDNYKHAIMKCAHAEGRINLTFRNILT